MAMDELIELSRSLSNPYVEGWKEEGKGVFGFLCTYLPEEIIHAAGLLPFRMRGRGATETSLADAWYGPVNCSFTRCCFQLVLEGKYDFLDGAVICYTCDHIRRMYDCWKGAKAQPSFLHYLGVPHTLTEHGMGYYRDEIINFKKGLEEHFGVEITEKKLKDAILLHNETRKLLMRLYELRKAKAPPVTGNQALSIQIASTCMPKEEYNKKLKSLLAQIEGEEVLSNIRLMIVGSVNDDPDLIDLIERQGAIVVTDSLCFGTRSFVDLVQEDGDPLDALVKRYYYHVPCGRTFGQYYRKLDFIKDMARGWNVDGIILEHIKFCDTHGGDNTLFQRHLEKEGIPTLKIERQYGPLADTGRLRTRVQAFLERIKGRRND